MQNILCTTLHANFNPINPFKPIGISYSYKFDQFISKLRVSGYYFSFVFNFNRTVCKQTVKICSDVEKRGSDPGLYCLPMSLKKDTRLIWVNLQGSCISVHFQTENKQRGS